VVSKRARSAARPAVEVNVVVDPSEEGGVDAIVRRLRRAGLSVAEILEAVGVVSGNVSPPRLAGLAHVRGVVAVEPSREIGLLGTPTDPAA
jgi:hypothetical protein